MEISISGQIEGFLLSIIFGAFLGLIYSCFTVIRLVLRPNRVKTFMFDLLYFVIAGILTFLFMIALDDGQIRLYILTGESIGFTIYYLTIGKLIVLPLRAIIKFIRKIIKTIVSPLINTIIATVIGIAKSLARKWFDPTLLLFKNLKSKFKKQLAKQKRSLYNLFRVHKYKKKGNQS